MTTPREKEPARTSGLRAVAAKDPAPRPATQGHKYLAGDVITRKYRLTQVLGEGGMGAVWLARNIALDVDVAIKLIRRDVATLETSQRLLQEARAAARLRHPSIVRVFDFGETEHDDPFIVMEVLSGDSLCEVLGKRGRLPAAEAVRTLLPIVSALSAAHQQGIVHRDLKPDNIVLVSDGDAGMVPKVVDFGIAKLREENVDGSITLAGSILGSPDYMSPEQARGRDAIDERTDVWSLSVVLYEAISGHVPFEAPNYNALLTAILNDEPVPTFEFAAGDAALWEIIKRGLSKDPDARWPSMRTMGTALAEWLLERDVDTDVAGTSLTAHWMRGSLHSVPNSQRRLTGSGMATVRPPGELIAEPAMPTPPVGTSPSITALPAAAAASADPALQAPPRRRWIWSVAAIFVVAGGAWAYGSGIGRAPVPSQEPTVAVATPPPTAAPAAIPTAAELPAPAPTVVAAVVGSAPTAPASSSAAPPAAALPTHLPPLKRPLEIPSNPNF